MSEYWLARASAALDDQPPDPTTALTHAQTARRICQNRFANNAGRYLYLGMRWEVQAVEVMAERNWAEAINCLRVASGAYRLARHRGRTTWFEDAGGRGVQRCLAMGVFVLGAA